MMIKTHALSRLRRLLFAPAAAAFVAALTPLAHAQPTTRGTPVLRTPSKRPAPDGAAPAPAAPAAAPAPAKPGAAPAAGAAGAAAGAGVAGTGAGAAGTAGAGAGAEDPIAAANVKTGPKEIDFKPKPGNFGVNFNLDDADLPDLVKAISNITGRRFIYGGKLRQIKATVYSPEKVTAGEAYSAFLSILETNGMTVIPHGRFLKIIETPGVVTETTPIFGTAAPIPDEDRYITRLYRLSHIDANEAAAVLNKFKSKEGDITVHGPGNLLIMTETGSNLQRMLRIIEEIDIGGAGEQIYVEPVNYTSAAEIATKLNDLLDLKKSGGAPGAPGGKGGGSGGGARIVADERGNALIIVANDPDYRRLLELINRLDVKQSNDGELRVTPLQYAVCKELSQTLNQILGGSLGAAGAAGRPGGVGGTPGGARPGAVPGAAGSGSLDEVFEGRVRVSCDEATNALVTTSSLRDYAQLRNVIDKLDMPRRQVFIEAVIMDVSIDRTLDYGVSYHTGAPFPVSLGGTTGTAVAYGGNNLSNSLGFPTPGSDALQALALGVQGPAIQGIGISIPAFGVAMHAFALDSDTNVLATPHILATDNIAAEISIGANIPLQTNFALPTIPGLTGQTGAQTGALASLLSPGLGSSFGGQRQDVGTKVKVIPHVNDSDQVRLELTEEISEAGAPQGTLGAIPINKRTANTTLIVRDQQTVVIGGLVRDFASNSETKIPILGDIPLIGNLFKQTRKVKQKSNLLLILTPYVIRDQDDLRAIFERKMEERQEFLDRYFVFSEGSRWNPPRDFSRSNGLVEQIRQSMIAQEEKARIEEETKPKARKIHEPGQPIPLPSMGGRGGGGADDAQPSAPAPGSPQPPVPRSRTTRPQGAQPRNVDRVE